MIVTKPMYPLIVFYGYFHQESDPSHCIIYQVFCKKQQQYFILSSIPYFPSFILMSDTGHKSFGRSKCKATYFAYDCIHKSE